MHSNPTAESLTSISQEMNNADIGSSGWQPSPAGREGATSLRDISSAQFEDEILALWRGGARLESFDIPQTRYATWTQRGLHAARKPHIQTPFDGTDHEAEHHLAVDEWDDRVRVEIHATVELDVPDGRPRGAIDIRLWKFPDFNARR